MIEKYLNEIVDLLCSVMPETWKKVVLHAKIGEDNYSIFYYVKIGGEYIQCYNLMEQYHISHEKVDAFSRLLYKYITEHIKNIEWNSFTLTLDDEMKFELEYSYDSDFDLFAWKKKYLI